MSAQRKMMGTLASVAAVLALLARGAQAQQPPAVPTQGKPAALVNGEPITLAEIESVQKRQPPPPHPLTADQQRQVRMEIVGMLIDDMLMQQFLRKNAPPMDPVEVNKELANLETNVKAKGNTMQDFLRESGQTEAQLRVNVSTMLQWAGYIKGRLSEADLKRYYDENHDFFDQVTVRASHIVLRVAPTAPPAEQQAAQAKLQAIRAEIVAGKLDFQEGVKKYSQCPSAANGGDIGYFQRKWVVEEGFARAAFALKVGDLSEVVQTDYGFHLIKVTDRKPGQPSVYEKIKEEVREICIEDMRQALIAQQRKTSQVEINLP